MLFYPAGLPLSRRPSPTPPGSSAATAPSSAGPGASSPALSRPCWCWPVCARARPSPSWAPGFGIGTATAWRYVTEKVGLLAARSPKLRKALRDATQARHAYVVIDGTLIPIDRIAADRPFYSGKHRRHGMNLQVNKLYASKSAAALNNPAQWLGWLTMPTGSVTKRRAGSGFSRVPRWGFACDHGNVRDRDHQAGKPPHVTETKRHNSERRLRSPQNRGSRDKND